MGAVERRTAEINGQPGVVFFDAESRAVLVIGSILPAGRSSPCGRSPTPTSFATSSGHFRVWRTDASSQHACRLV
jgi:hypothetical protein